uniref:Threonyl-tRNA synthetase 1 n=1 Tax=Rhinolophus ferrumequinum TaxID=59479 RepID=A0A671ES94_RHIFE
MSEEKASSPSGTMGAEEKPVGASEEKRKEGGKKKNKEGCGDGGCTEGNTQVLFSAFPGSGTESICT